MKAKVGK